MKEKRQAAPTDLLEYSVNFMGLLAQPPVRVFAPSETLLTFIQRFIASGSLHEMPTLF
ncbi:MAG: hypothetical protein AAFX99_00980 [Myxococcota bacterium]